MKFWDNIIQTAMLGTNRKDVVDDDFPEDMSDAIQTINTNATIDAEEEFLQKVTLAFNYRQSGVTPDHQPGATLSQAPREEKKYCNSNAVKALKEILFEESIGLLIMWLQLCLRKEQIIIPDLIPALLDKSLQHKQLKSLVRECTGKRGAWLSQFNRDWSFTNEANAEELWQTGTASERKNVLQQLRSSDASTAREWLQAIWAVENANTKTDLLGALSINLSDDDMPWLETLLNEKSQKVKEQVSQLLKQIPASAIVQTYQQFLSRSVNIKKEKGLLGLSSKTLPHFKLPDSFDETIFKLGIEKLSNRKEYNDDEFIIFQVMQFVAPVFWEQHFLLTPSEIIQLFQKEEPGKKFIPAIVAATSQFKDSKWADALMKNSQIFYLNIIPLLPFQEQEFYSNKFFIGNEESIIRYAGQREEEWSAELTKNIFKHAAKNYYTYNRSFYNRHIHLIPVQAVGLLEKCVPQEEHLRESWSKISEYILKLTTLKIQTIKAFQ
jgi:Family of unknown function (DUF5691)